MNSQEAIALLRNLEDALDSYCELNEKGKTAFRMAITALECSKSSNGWIPCTPETMPDIGQEVLCQCRAGIIKVLKLDADLDWYQDAEHSYMSGFVLAWQPLPSPYREEDDT